MKKQIISLCLIPLLCTQVYAQTKIEGAFNYNQKQSLEYAGYLPKGFQKGKALPVIIAFHPLNSLKWNVQSWRDELQAFAEKNKVLLICPEVQFRVSLNTQTYSEVVKRMTIKLLGRYDVQPNCIYSFGAGIGANIALKLGVSQRNFISGLILIASNPKAISLSTSDYSKCFNLPCFIIHGKNDHLQQKYYPMRKALSEAGACIKSMLIDKSGSSVNPQIKKDYLSTAFVWVHNYSCNKPEYIWNDHRTLRALRQRSEPIVSVDENKVRVSNINPAHGIQRIKIYNEDGILVKIVRKPSLKEEIQLPHTGNYTITLQSTLRTQHFNVEIRPSNFK